MRRPRSDFPLSVVNRCAARCQRSHQGLQQSRRRLQIRGLEALREFRVSHLQEPDSVLVAPSFGPKSGEVGRGAEFPGKRRLPLGLLDRGLEELSGRIEITDPDIWQRVLGLLRNREPAIGVAAREVTAVIDMYLNEELDL